MGQDVKALRSRIKSVDSTLHLTKAMGLVASSKMRNACNAMLKSREYSAALTEMIHILTSCRECEESVYMQSNGSDTMRLIVIAGDRGLAGGYNANVFRMADGYEAEIIPIGRRACERYGGEQISSETFSYDDAAELAERLCNEFKQGAFGRLGIISTEYVSMMTQLPHLKGILPLHKHKHSKAHSAVFEPDEITVLESAIPQYVAGIIHAAVRESFASEVTARRMAMDSAGKNAQEMIDNLQLEYNRVRQGAITQEITEIVAGSEQ